MKARDWLVSKGLAKDGRGKFSNDAKAALAASGLTFEDWPKDATVPVAKPAKPTKPEKPAKLSSDEEIMCKSDFNWPEDEYKAVDKDGKEQSMRWVCDNSNVSICVCPCGGPHMVRALGDALLTVKKRRAVSTKE